MLWQPKGLIQTGRHWRRPQVVAIDSDAQAYFDAAAIAPDDTRKGHINDLVLALKAADAWDDLDFMYLLAAHEAQLSLVNLKNPGTFNATNVSAMAFEVDRGYTGDGAADYLDSNFNPATAGGVFVQDSAHNGIWSRTSAGLGGVDMGLRAVAGSYDTFVKHSSGPSFGRISDNTDTNFGTPASGAGHFIFTRTSSSAKACYKDGASQGTASVASTGVGSFSIFIGATNNSGTPIDFATRQYAAAHAGTGLNSTKADAIYDALQTYMTAVGA
jgi:hypothetical protein